MAVERGSAGAAHPGSGGRLPSGRTPPTSAAPQQISLVQQSFEHVEPIADTAAELFYGRLFEIAPEVEPLFGDDMVEQGRKLMSTLGDAFTPEVEEAWGTAYAALSQAMISAAYDTTAAG